MKRIGLLSLMLTATVCAADLSNVRKRVEQWVAALPIVAHFDQPYAGTTNPKQRVDLYLPKDRKRGGPLPVIVFIHGGGWRNGDRIRSAGAVIRFVRTGHYAGVAVSYRLSGEAKWPAQICDCKAAIRWIRGNAEKFGLDPDHIGVWGGSAGGHLVSLLGTSGGVKELEGSLGEFTQLSSRVTCVVNQCGPQDFKLPLMFRRGQPVMEDPAVAGLLGGKLADKPDAVVAASPVTYVTPDDAAFLTLHGAQDKRVDFAHAKRIDAALRAAGVPSLLIPVIGSGHSIKHPQMHDRVGKFFDRHLRGMQVDIPAEPLAPVEPAR